MINYIPPLKVENTYEVDFVQDFGNVNENATVVSMLNVSELLNGSFALKASEESKSKGLTLFDSIYFIVVSLTTVIMIDNLQRN